MRSMRTRSSRHRPVALAATFAVLLALAPGGCARSRGASSDSPGSSGSTSEGVKVTFIELGSVNCIPCRMMQPLMRKVEETFPRDVKVVFYDVWTEKGRPYAEQYQINVIPTQVFLDAKGKEFFRHEGFFPEDDLMRLLRGRGAER